MRILHTADWHLHERLKRVSRRPHLLKRLQEIASYLDEYRVDVMVVAGDLFSQNQRMEELSEAVGDIQRIFKPFLLKGGTIVAISGNHDNEYVFNFMRSLLDLAVPIDANATGPRPPGRLYLAARPTVLELADPAGQSVQFVLLPYPTTARYLSDDTTPYESLAQRNELLHRKFEEKRDLMLNTVINKHLRSVMVSHIHVRGTRVYTRHHVSESDTVVIEQGEIPAYLDYVAYGHIHAPGEVLSNTPHIRYAGSIERMNAGECNDEKSVVLVDIGPDGRRGDPICLPLRATPIYHIEILDPDTDMQNLRERYPDHADALVSYRLVYTPGEHNLDRLTDELESIFPNYYEARIEAEGSTVPATVFEVTAPDDMASTVERYLQDNLPDDAQRDEILALARGLLAKME